MIAVDRLGLGHQGLLTLRGFSGQASGRVAGGLLRVAVDAARARHCSAPVRDATSTRRCGSPPRQAARGPRQADRRSRRTLRRQKHSGGGCPDRLKHPDGGARAGSRYGVSRQSSASARSLPPRQALRSVTRGRPTRSFIQADATGPLGYTRKRPEQDRLGYRPYARRRRDTAVSLSPRGY